MPERLDVLVVCDDLAEGVRLRQEVGASSKHRVRILVANATHRHSARFLGAQLRAFVRHPVAASACAASGDLSISVRSLEDQTLLRRVHADIGLHAAGAIYRRSFIDCFSIGLLNAHIGILPGYRGRSVVQWSLLHGDAPGISVFLIDEGIDTGAIVHTFEVSLPVHCTNVDAAKSYLFSLDGAAYRDAIELLAQPGFTPTTQALQAGRRFFVMSALLTDCVNDILAAASDGDLG